MSYHVTDCCCGWGRLLEGGWVVVGIIDAECIAVPSLHPLKVRSLPESRRLNLRCVGALPNSRAEVFASSIDRAASP